MLRDTNVILSDDALADVLALVSNHEAEALRTGILDRWSASREPAPDALVICEFDMRGRFLQARRSDLASRTSQLLAANDGSAIVAEMRVLAERDAPKVGQVLPSRIADGFHWCVPMTEADSLSGRWSGVRTLFITEALFREVVLLFNRDARLTPAELRLLYQLVSGTSLTQAATADNVSSETKRSHLKRAMSKLDCSSQPEIGRMLLSQLVHVLLLCEADTRQNKKLEAFLHTHLAGEIALSTHMVASGRALRVLEIGPRNGRPVLVFHGYLLPCLIAGAHEALKQAGLRLIIPIRRGYFEEATTHPATSGKALAQETIEDVADYVAHRFEGSVPVAGQSLGAHYAIAFAQTAPDNVSHLILASINLLSGSHGTASPARRFFGGLRDLSSRIGIYEALAKQFYRVSFATNGGSQRVLRSLFAQSNADLSVVNGSAHGPGAHTWFKDLHFACIPGIAADFKIASEPVDRETLRKDLPIHIVHGDEDPFSHMDEVTAFADHLGTSNVTALAGLGHLASAKDPATFWAAVRRAL